MVGPVAHADHRRKRERLVHRGQQVVAEVTGLAGETPSRLGIHVGNDLGVPRNGNTERGVRFIPRPPHPVVPDVVRRQQAVYPEPFAAGDGLPEFLPLLDDPVGVGVELRGVLGQPLFVSRQAVVSQHSEVDHADAAAMRVVPFDAREECGRSAQPQTVRRGHGLLDPIEPHLVAVAGFPVQPHQVQDPQEQVRLVGQASG